MNSIFRTARASSFSTGGVTAVAIAASALITACGGGGGASGSDTTASPQSVSMPLMISDASSQDWSSIQVTVTSVVFTSASGDTANLLSAPMTVNLEQLDNLAEVLGTAQLTPGATYSGAKITVSANPGDVSLTVSSDPEAGFPEAPSTANAPDIIPASRIQIQGAQGAVGGKTVTIPVAFVNPVVVPSSSSGVTTMPGVDIEFDLSHPAFIVGHVPVGSGSTIWAVNFKGPLRHKPVVDLTRLVLRHMYGTVGSVSSDNNTLTIARDLPTMPIVSPETFTAGNPSVPISVDAANGTLFYNLDAGTRSTINNFSSVASTLASEQYVRVAARYQEDGTLVATRIFASASFDKVFKSPEGHVIHVDNTSGTGFTVDNADGRPIHLAVDANTQFFFRNPGTASDVTPIGVGPGFLTSHELVRGFKVHVTAVDVTAVPLVAATVDIEAAPYEGRIANVTTAGFSLTDGFNTSNDDYSLTLSYLASTTPNGKDPLTGAAIAGFKYWDFAFPTQVISGAGATASFAATTGGSVNFGGSAGAYEARGLAYSVWGDAANSNGWSARDAILIPALLPKTTVAAGILGAGNSFTINANGGTTPVTVDFSTVAGSATLVYQVDRTGGFVTVSPQDIEGADGLAALTSGLQAGAKVLVSAVPQPDGSLRAYVITYFTGTAAQ